MTYVRDKMLPKSDYKGRPTEASDELCPCRPCFNAHDCGREYMDNPRWTADREAHYQHGVRYPILSGMRRPTRT